MKVDDKTPPFFVVFGEKLTYFTEKRENDMYLESVEISTSENPRKKVNFTNFPFTKVSIEEDGKDPNSLSLTQRRNVLKNLLEYKE